MNAPAILTREQIESWRAVMMSNFRSGINTPEINALCDMALRTEEALALLREWQQTELDSQDEDFQPWIAQFTARIEALLAKE